jgi:Tfp pilus assembly protein PilV
MAHVPTTLSALTAQNEITQANLWLNDLTKMRDNNDRAHKQEQQKTQLWCKNRSKVPCSYKTGLPCLQIGLAYFSERHRRSRLGRSRSRPVRFPCPAAREKREKFQTCSNQYQLKRNYWSARRLPIINHKVIYLRCSTWAVNQSHPNILLYIGPSHTRCHRC